TVCVLGDAGAEESAAPAAVAAAPGDDVPDSAPKLLRQTQAEADAKSAGCLSCHNGIEPMHVSGQVNLGCVDCHGGNVGISAGSAQPGSTEYAAAQRDAHVAPRH